MALLDDLDSLIARRTGVTIQMDAVKAQMNDNADARQVLNNAANALLADLGRLRDQENDLKSQMIDLLRLG